MNVLHIPSWYPCERTPYGGRFFFEQARAISNVPGTKVGIINWGQLKFQLKLREPIKSIGKTIKFLSAQQETRHLTEDLTEYYVPHLSWTSLLLNGNIDSLARKIAKLPRPNIIHAQVSFPAGYLAYKLSREWNVPYVITEHSGPFPFREFRTSDGISPKISVPLKRAQKVFAVSSFLKNEIERHVKIQCLVIPNMVNTDFFSFKLREKKKDSFRLFSLSHLSPAKGIGDLLLALTIAREQGSEAELYLGGEGRMIKWIRRYIKNTKMSDRIHLLGEQNKEQSLLQYQLCDCYIMPSHLETFSIVLLEAMACGKPVIATDCGGPSDIVVPNTGILIPPNQPEVMAEEICKMEKDFYKYDPLQIRDYCMASFSESKISERIVDIYTSLI